MECPFCKNELPDGAAYCYVCMKRLKPKTDVRVRRRKKGAWPFVILASAIALFAGVFFLIASLNQPKAPVTESILPAEKTFIANFSNALSALSVSDLVSVDDFKKAGGGSHYELPTAFQYGVSELIFSDDSILFALPELTGKELPDALTVLECAIDGAYGYYAENVKELLVTPARFSETSTGALHDYTLLRSFPSDLTHMNAQSQQFFSDRYGRKLVTEVVCLNDGAKNSYYLKFFSEGT